MEPKVKTPKNPQGLHQNPKKFPGPKINPPKKSYADFVALKSSKSQAKEVKSSLKQKGIPVTVKPIDWIEAVKVLYTAGHHGKMQTIV